MAVDGARRGRLRLGLLTAFAAAWVPGLAAGVDSRPRVVELFTSEGCSSCPPAEDLLARFADRPDVLALAFHVDYWDSLGWNDRFALPAAVRRQRGYATNFGRTSVYTPEFVIDGTVDALPRGFPGEPSAAIAQTVRLRIGGSGDVLAVEVGSGERASRACEVLLVSFAARATSVVRRGENAGRTLPHANLVRSIAVLGDWSGEARSFDVARASLPADATDLAILVQIKGQREIIAALRAPLSPLR